MVESSTPDTCQRQNLLEKLLGDWFNCESSLPAGLHSSGSEVTHHLQLPPSRQDWRTVTDFSESTFPRMMMQKMKCTRTMSLAGRHHKKEPLEPASKWSWTAPGIMKRQAFGSDGTALESRNFHFQVSYVFKLISTTLVYMFSAPHLRGTKSAHPTMAVRENAPITAGAGCKRPMAWAEKHRTPQTGAFCLVLCT